jgi:TfoX/Sxy family transcriptional regulator of competence genes
MPYDEHLADRVREALSDQKKVEEKQMFRGLCFMVNGKMCVCVSADELMCRVGPHGFEEMLEKPGTRTMIHNGKPMKGFVYVSEEGFRTKRDFDFWINASLVFNKEAKASKKKTSKKATRPDVVKKKKVNAAKKVKLPAKKKRS